MTAPAADTRPFSPFEWMLALRYLRARRKEGFISVIAGFSFLGIVLGVATLIIVMAVMNGFRKELFNKILGLDGHVVVYKVGSDDFPELRRCGQAIGGCRRRQARRAPDRGAGHRVHARAGARRQGARLERGGPEGAAADLQEHTCRYSGRLRQPGRHRHRCAPGAAPAHQCRRQCHPGVAAGRDDAFRHGAAHQVLQDRCALRDGHGRVRPQHDLHAAGRSAALLQQRRFRRRARGDRRGPRERRPVRRQHEGSRHSIDALRRLAAAQRKLLHRARGRAQHDVHHPVHHRAGGGVQHHFRPDDAGEGQGTRHRHPAHHGGHARRHHARVSDHRRQHRRGRHPRRMRAGYRVLLEDRRDSPVCGLDDQHQAVRSRDLLPDKAACGLELAGPLRPSFVMALVLSVLATLYPSWRASRLDPVEALRYE